jgi:nucleoside-diphosphate-sugar epimerase
MAPNIILEYVDVRDVAAAHVAAMTAPDAGGHRFILSGESLSLMEISEILRAEFPRFARRLPRVEMPHLLARLLAFFDASIRDSRPFMGIRKRSDSSNGVRLLGRRPIAARDSVIATAVSAMEQRLVSAPAPASSRRRRVDDQFATHR